MNWNAMNNLIKKYEGFRSTAYLCPAGIWTIGYGTTLINGKPVAKGMTISKNRAEELLNFWIKKEVFPYIADLTLSLRQTEALTSLIYNIGGPTFKKSKLRTAILNKDYVEIVRQWDFGFKSGLKGIVKRRVEELYYFLSEC